MADSPNSLQVPGAVPGLAPGVDSPAPNSTLEDDKKISHHAQSILKTSRDAEFLHSFLRVDHGDSDSEDGDQQARPAGSAPGAPGQRGAGEERSEGDGGGAAERGGLRGAAERAYHGAEEGTTRRHHKATFKEVVKELELTYGGLGALGASKKGRRGRTIRGEEVYTDKDRAAAVQMGHRDIKQSLRMKRHQERVHALQLPEEADGGTLLALGQYELRQGHTDIAIAFVNKALQLCPEDKTALVARSKCYLLLGQPRLALQDAETALGPDRNYVRAIFQKAEALYHMGDFEHSLMYYYRGLRLRPEQAMFRLGVQKAQEAIENTIGTGIEESCKVMMDDTDRSKSSRAGSGAGALKTKVTSPSSGGRSLDASPSPSSSPDGQGSAPASDARSPSPVTPTSETSKLAPMHEPRTATPGSDRAAIAVATRLPHQNQSAAGEDEECVKKLLGELFVDKQYLEHLLNHPDIRCARKDRSSQIAEFAEDGVEFLRNRQEFWRQQKLTSTPASSTGRRRRRTVSTASSARDRTATTTTPSTTPAATTPTTPATPQIVT